MPFSEMGKSVKGGLGRNTGVLFGLHSPVGPNQAAAVNCPSEFLPDSHLPSCYFSNTTLCFWTGPVQHSPRFPRLSLTL